MATINNHKYNKWTMKFNVIYVIMETIMAMTLLTIKSYRKSVATMTKKKNYFLIFNE